MIPLGIPMLAGPGSISTVMVLMAESGRWWQSIPVFVAIALTAVFSYWVLAAADRVRRYLGETGNRIMMRFMGLLLVAVARAVYAERPRRRRAGAAEVTVNPDVA